MNHTDQDSSEPNEVLPDIDAEEEEGSNESSESKQECLPVEQRVLSMMLREGNGNSRKNGGRYDIPHEKMSYEEWVRRFIRYLYDKGYKRKETHRVYTKTIRLFGYFLFLRGKEIYEAEQGDFYDYRDHYLNQDDASKNTIAVRVAYLRRVFEWFVTIGKMKNNPYPLEMSTKGGMPSRPPLILHPSTIFFFRKQRNIPVETAFLFELLLSTGMRLNESRQVRAKDVVFGRTPFDASMSKASPYYTSSIHISPAAIVSKGRIPRTVFLSLIATRILNCHCKHWQIPMDSSIPLLPWGEAALQGKLSDLTESFKRTVQWQQVPEKRDKFYADISVEDISDPRFRRMIQNKIGKHQDMTELESGDRERDARGQTRDHIYPHCLRHTFASIMYHRSYFGETNNFGRVMSLLGHTDSTTTYQYLTRGSVVESNEEWARVITGTPTDWPGILS